MGFATFKEPFTTFNPELLTIDPPSRYEVGKIKPITSRILYDGKIIKVFFPWNEGYGFYPAMNKDDFTFTYIKNNKKEINELFDNFLIPFQEEIIKKTRIIADEEKKKENSIISNLVENILSGSPFLKEFISYPKKKDEKKESTNEFDTSRPKRCYLKVKKEDDKKKSQDTTYPDTSKKNGDDWEKIEFNTVVVDKDQKPFYKNYGLTVQFSSIYYGKDINKNDKNICVTILSKITKIRVQDINDTSDDEYYNSTLPNKIVPNLEEDKSSTHSDE